MSNKQFRKRVALLLILLVTLLVLQGVAGAQDVVEDRILVWVGGGSQPGEHSSAYPGQLAFFYPTGALQILIDVPPQTSRVVACGDTATSPDGQTFAFFVGQDTGALYLMRDAQISAPMDTGFHALGCIGNGTFRYSPDSSRFATIDYDSVPTYDTFPASGSLRIGSTATSSFDVSFDNATAFAIDDNNVAFVSFFNDNDGEATEAAVFLWDGATDREIATLFSEDDCRFTSAQIGIVSGEQLALVMGHRCTRNETYTEWQYYTIDAGTRTATLSLNGRQPASFFWYARTNNVYVSSDATHIFFTVPDGLAANTVALAAVDLASMGVTAVVPNNAVMPRFNNRPYDTANHTPVMSPDGNWLAMVTNNANNEAKLVVLDLANPSLPPIEIATGDRGDTIAEILFTPDSRRIVFVSGAPGTGDNSIFAVDLDVGNDFRVQRGHFSQGVISPDGSVVAMMEWQLVDGEPPYLNFVLVEVESSAHTTLYEGADVVDGEVENQRFVYPLTWWGG